MDVEQFLDQPRLGFFIDSKFFTDPGESETELISPHTKKPWKSLVQADAKSAKKAILSAQKSFLSWKKVPPPERGKFLRTIGSLIDEYAMDFAKLMALEMGKPIAQGKGEAAYASGYFYWFAGEAERISGATIPSQFEDKRLMITYEPLGVSAAITPWNFPLAMAARKIAAAIAAGCTIICKPSPESPATLLLFANLCNMANLPPGVVNIIPGPEVEIGKALLESDIVRKISFTGSTAVGKILYEKSADTLKKLTLELGGNAPLLVFDDADLKLAVSQTIAAKFRNNGQTCVAPNRIFVQEGVYEEFTARLIEGVKKLKVGDPFDPATDLSPILHPASVERVKKHIEDAVQKGAIPEHTHGKEPFHPCILIDAAPGMLLFREETFGPVLPLIKFKTEEQGLAMANDTEFGLASYFFTQNLTRAERIAQGLQFGIVGVNDGLPSTPQASFGGIKHSGFGREGGPTGLKEYLLEKYISTKF